MWIDAQTAVAPTLTERVKAIGSNVGRVRVIELQPNTYADALYNSHLDDNNRLNPDGEGWVLRCFMQLTHNPDSVMVLREDIDDPSTETRISLPAGAQLVVDSERMWHSVWHQGDEPALLPDHVGRVRAGAREVDLGEQPARPPSRARTSTRGRPCPGRSSPRSAGPLARRTTATTRRR